MESRPASITKTSRAGATPLHHDLPHPEEIVIWEILVRLPPKSLLRCHAVCRAWRHATSTRPFLLAHHDHQPCLPVVVSSRCRGDRHENILAFDHRAAADARLQHVARLDDSFCHEASCDGLLILSKYGRAGRCFSVCNPVTCQHAPLPQLSGFSLLGMYAHRPTGEYRLLLLAAADQGGCYVYALGSDQPPRNIRGLEVAASACLLKPALVRDCLHWFPVHYQSDPQQRRTASKVVILFDTASESFRQMRAPLVPAKSYIFEIDGTLGIYSFHHDMGIADIWMLRNYEGEVWTYKYRVKLPDVGVKKWFGQLNGDRYVSVHSVDGRVLLLVSHRWWMFYVDIDGKLVYKFHRDGQRVYACKLRLKQTLVPHTFFAALEGYAVNASPFHQTDVE